MGWGSFRHTVCIGLSSLYIMCHFPNHYPNILHKSYDLPCRDFASKPALRSSVSQYAKGTILYGIRRAYASHSSPNRLLSTSSSVLILPVPAYNTPKFHITHRITIVLLNIPSPTHSQNHPPRAVCMITPPTHNSQPPAYDGWRTMAYGPVVIRR